MKHIPYTSRIFIGLFIITMLLIYVALALSSQFTQQLYNSIEHVPLINKTSNVRSAKSDVKLLSTDNWVSYTDKAYPVSFKYPKAWTVTSATPNTLGFTDITIKPNDKSPNFHIAISRDGYLGFDGLKQTRYSMGKLHGMSVGENLIGIKSGEYYYTFDGSLNPKLTPEFQTLMSTVAFH